MDSRGCFGPGGKLADALGHLGLAFLHELLVDPHEVLGAVRQILGHGPGTLTRAQLLPLHALPVSLGIFPTFLSAVCLLMGHVIELSLATLMLCLKAIVDRSLRILDTRS